jgi:glutaredoxin
VSLRVYWQPGCSSCLKTKEFLRSHGIAFESVNVLEQRGAFDELRALGARTVPVVRNGDRYVTAQDLRELAAFVGVPYAAAILSEDAIAEKLERVLAAVRRHAAQIPDARLGTVFKGRDRTYRDLVHHVFVIARTIIECAHGAEMRFESFLELPAAHATGADLQQFAAGIETRFRAWRTGGPRPARVQTFYGERDFASVLERTAWHAAQHGRQVQDIVRKLGADPDGPLGDAELGGLPLPEEIWDDEIAMV